MAATVPTPADRYFQPGRTQIIVVPTWASPKVLANLTAGTNISQDVAAVSGFTVSGADLPTPDLGRRFVPNVPGRITADQSSIDLYADPEGADATAIFTLDQETNIAFLDNGQVADSNMDTFPVRVLSVSRVRDIEAVPVIRVMFSITDEPETGLTYPAS